MSLPKLFLLPPVLGVQESTSTQTRGQGRAVLGTALTWGRLGVPPIPASLLSHLASRGQKDGALEI